MYKTLVTLLTIALLAGCNQPRTREELLQAGRQQLAARDASAAIIYFKNALEQDKNYFEARLELGRVYNAIGRYGAAEQELKKALLQRPGAKEARRELVRAYALSGKPDEALKTLDQLSPGPDDFEMRELSAWAHAQRREYSYAAGQLEDILRSQPGRPSALEMLARVQLMLGMTGKAFDHVSELLRSNPANANALHLLAQCKMIQKDPEAALAAYDRIMTAAPGDWRAYFRKGLLLADLGRPHESVQLGDVLITRFSNRAEGYELKGIGLFSLKNYREAAMALQRSLTMQPSAAAYYFLGLCDFYTDEPEQTANLMRQALALDPEMIKAREMLALAHLRKNRVDDAIAEIRKVLDRQVADPAAHSILASAYLARGMNTEAIAELERAIRLDPGFTEARVKKGILELSTGRAVEAESDLAAALRIDPDLLNNRLLLASCYLKQNQSEKAITAAQQGLRKQKSDALLYNVIADANLQRQNRNDAMAALQKAQEADPDYDITYYKMAALQMFTGEQEKASALLKKFAEHQPQNARAQLAAASIFEKNDDRTAAQTFYERAVATGSPEAAGEAAQYYLRNNKYDRAIDILDRTLAKDSAVIPLLLLKGRACLEHARFIEALGAFDAASRLGAPAGFAGVINTYYAMHKPEKALERIRSEMQEKPESTEVQAELVRFYMQMKRQAEAEAAAVRMIQSAPGSASGYLMLAAVRQAAGRTDKAIEAIREGSNVRDGALQLMLGTLYAAQKQYTEALAEYHKAEALMPGSAVPGFQYASLLQGMNKRKEAIGEYERLVRRFPENVAALNNLAYLYAEDGRELARALPYAIRAYALAPREAVVQDTLGFVLLKNDRAEEAMKALRQAAAMIPDNPSVQYHLALALDRRHEAAEAARCLRKALALGDFPESGQAKLLLDKVSREAGPSR